MGNGIGDDYRKKSTILGDSDILSWAKEQEDKRKFRERQQKIRIARRIPDSIKKKPMSGVEKEWLNNGMSLLTIWQRRMS